MYIIYIFFYILFLKIYILFLWLNFLFSLKMVFLQVFNLEKSLYSNFYNDIK